MNKINDKTKIKKIDYLETIILNDGSIVRCKREDIPNILSSNSKSKSISCVE